ncbi:MAG: hypothetical protein JNL58_22300 [Planctomyces sp.]|nr:hypothetical protein [Planctomyces sp.]
MCQKTIFLSLLLIAINCPASYGVDHNEDDRVILRVLEAANDEQTSNSRRGAMDFELEKIWFVDGEAGERRFLSGTIEWDENYLYLDGERDERKPEAVGELRRHDRVRVAVAGGKVLGLLDRLKFSSASADGSLLVFAPESMLAKAGLDSLYPNPEKLLTDPRILLNGNLSTSLFATMRSNELPDNLKDDRLVEVSDRNVKLTCRFRNGSLATHTFDLGLGARCTEIKVAGYDGKFETIRRTWKQTAEGQWYPETSTLHMSRDDFEGETNFECRLTVKGLRRLEKKAIVAPLTLTSFGTIARGTSIQEVSADGNVRHRKHLWNEGENAEQELDKLAEELSRSGLGANGER